MRLFLLLPATLLTACAAVGGATAGPAAERAEQRMNAIGAGDVPAITAAYAPGAVLHWVGGPLDGTYTGAQLAATWTKFAAAQGPLRVTLADVQGSTNPRGSTVTANVLLQGKAAIRVRYVLTYRDDKLVGEVWQVVPALKL